MVRFISLKSDLFVTDAGFEAEDEQSQSRRRLKMEVGVWVFTHPEMEDPCVRIRQALVGGNHLSKELRMDGERGEGSQQPAVTWWIKQTHSPVWSNDIFGLLGLV